MSSTVTKYLENIAYLSSYDDTKCFSQMNKGSSFDKSRLCNV